MLTPGTPGWRDAVSHAAGAEWDVLLACVSFPKQELFAHALRAAGLAVLLILALASLSDYPARTPALACLLALASVWAALPTRRRPGGAVT